MMPMIATQQQSLSSVHLGKNIPSSPPPHLVVTSQSMFQALIVLVYFSPKLTNADKEYMLVISRYKPTTVLAIR